MRLPTFFCAPNFSWLMVADAHDAVSAVPGVTRADIALDDHFVAEEINGGVAARAGFVAAFPGEAVEELDDLRGPSSARPRSPARTAWPGRWSTPGPRPRSWPLRLGQVPPSLDLDPLRSGGPPSGCRTTTTRRCCSTRTASPVTAAQVPLHLRRARLTGVGIEGERRHMPRPARQAVRRHVLTRATHGPAGLPPAGPWRVLNLSFAVSK